MLPLTRSIPLLRNQPTHHLRARCNPLFTSRSQPTQACPSGRSQPLLLVHGIKNSSLTRAFSSTHQTRATSPQSPPPPGPSPGASGTGQQHANPSFESAGFGKMFKDSSRGVKIVLIGGLCILATAESVAWTIWGWAKVKGYFSDGEDGAEGTDGLTGSETKGE